MEKDILQRTCVGCRKKIEKKALTRYVLDKDVVVEDIGQQMKGRGAYLCPTCQKEYNNPGENKEKRRIQKILFHNLLK